MSGIPKTLIALLLIVKLDYGQNSDANFPPPENPPIINVNRATNKIAVDGRINEKDWSDADVVTDFFKVEPHQREI